MGGITMNEKYLSDEFQNEIVEKLSNEIASIIVKQVESAINNADGFKDKPKVERFDVNTLQPFDKVLVRDYSTKNWGADFFLKLREERDYVYCILTSAWKYCIPYNEETKHLLGTKEDCPEYYKWWEE